MQLHERKGKHGAAVTCGDWLSDNRLGLGSGTRVKISKPLPEDAAQWESYSKFKLSGMLSRVPRKFKDAGACSGGTRHTHQHAGLSLPLARPLLLPLQITALLPTRRSISLLFSVG